MVQAIANKCRDVVTLIPVDGVSREVVENHFFDVLRSISQVVNVIAVCVDHYYIYW